MVEEPPGPAAAGRKPPIAVSQLLHSITKQHVPGRHGAQRLAGLYGRSGGAREIFASGSDATALPPHAVRHPIRTSEALWDQVEVAPPPARDSGPWDPMDRFLPDASEEAQGPSDDEVLAPGELSWREQGEAFLNHVCFQVTMAMMILANALVIGMETDQPDMPWWDLIETGFLVMFTAEFVLKVLVLTPSTYFDWNHGDFAWNFFDFCIVSLGGVDVGMSLLFGTAGSGGIATVFRIIRLLRILRIFRIVKFLRQLYMLAFGFALAAVAVFWVTILMVFVLYVCSIILVRTVGHAGDDDPHAEVLQAKFGSIVRAMLTLFEIMSSPELGIYEDVLWERPSLAMFIVMFIIFGSFGMIALLTGVISESMFDKNNVRMEEERLERENMRKLLIRTCEHWYDDLPSQCASPARLEGAYVWEVQELLPRIASLFESEGVDYAGEDLFAMLDILDQDGTITRDEFKFFIVQLAEGVRPLLIMRLFYAVNGLSKQSDDILGSVKRMKEASRSHELRAGTSSSEDCRMIMHRLDRLGHSVDGMSVRMDRLNSKVEDIGRTLDDQAAAPPKDVTRSKADSKESSRVNPIHKSSTFPALPRRLTGALGFAS